MSKTSKLDFTRTASIVLSWPHADRDMLRRLMDEKDKTVDRPVTTRVPKPSQQPGRGTAPQESKEKGA